MDTITQMLTCKTQFLATLRILVTERRERSRVTLVTAANQKIGMLNAKCASADLGCCEGGAKYLG